MKKDYQFDYAAHRAQMYDFKSRAEKGERIVKMLQDHFNKKNLKNLTLLDVGASSGIIDNVLAKKLGQVVGIDIDEAAIKFAKRSFKAKNLTFKVDDALKLNIPANSFDVVVCTHIYEHVTNPKKLFQEIYRVLKPGGVCYLAAVNKWWPIEPHYDLPFLSFIPKNMAHKYVKAFNKAELYYETLYSYKQLSEVTTKFIRHEYTSKIFRSPIKYGYTGKISSNSLIKTMALAASPLMKYASPTFFWLLEKPNVK